jgi:hypothetical protein
MGNHVYAALIRWTVHTVQQEGMTTTASNG